MTFSDQHNQYKIFFHEKIFSSGWVSSYQRRRILIEEMEKLEEAKVCCRGCAAECCTFTSNTMQVTPIEAVDIFWFLLCQGGWDYQLENLLRKSIEENRLDRIPGSGRRDYFRPSYTCPFFKKSELGCRVNIEYKPYGCLGFNPSLGKGGLRACKSNRALLEKREQGLGGEDLQNQKIKKTFKLNWEKKPIPIALIDLWDYFCQL